MTSPSTTEELVKALKAARGRFWSIACSPHKKAIVEMTAKAGMEAISAVLFRYEASKQKGTTDVQS